MLTSIGRAAARRTLTVGASRLMPSAISAGPALAIRSFSVSRWAPAAATSATVGRPKKTTSAATKKQTTKKTTKAKDDSKTTKTKTKAKAKAKPGRKASTGSSTDKPKPGRKAKVLTPEQKLRADVRELKKMALLEEPTRLPDRSWMIFYRQELDNNPELRQNIAESSKKLSGQYKELSSYDMQDYEARAKENRELNQKNHEIWINSHSPEATYLANRARRTLARKTEKFFKQLQDSRHPKRPLGDFFLWSREQPKSPTLKQTDYMKELGKQWRELSAAEKRPFEEQAARDKKAHESETLPFMEKVQKLKEQLQEQHKLELEQKKSARVKKTEQ